MVADYLARSFTSSSLSIKRCSVPEVVNEWYRPLPLALVYSYIVIFVVIKSSFGVHTLQERYCARMILPLRDKDDELYRHSNNQLPGQKFSSLDAMISPQSLTPHGPNPTCPNLRFIRIQVVPLAIPWTQPSPALFMFILSLKEEKKEVKIFYMLFKLINITYQGQFGKPALWLEAHQGSAHLVKLNLAEASFYLWRICHLEPIDHGDVPSFPSTRMHVSFYLPIPLLPAIYLPQDFFSLFLIPFPSCISTIYLPTVIIRLKPERDWSSYSQQAEIWFPLLVLFTYHW